jgi:hypothetical protein
MQHRPPLRPPPAPHGPEAPAKAHAAPHAGRRLHGGDELDYLRTSTAPLVEDAQDDLPHRCVLPDRRLVHLGQEPLPSPALTLMWKNHDARPLRVLQPCQRVGSLSAPENLEFRVGEVLGYFGCDRQNCAVRNCGHALDLAMMVANEAYVFD